jgi:hypothetical protein
MLADLFIFIYLLWHDGNSVDDGAWCESVYHVLCVGVGWGSGMECKTDCEMVFVKADGL